MWWWVQALRFLQRVGAVALDGARLDGAARGAVAVEGLLAVGGVLGQLLLHRRRHGRQLHVGGLLRVIGRGGVRRRRREQLDGQVDVGVLVAVLVELLQRGGDAQVLL